MTPPVNETARGWPLPPEIVSVEALRVSPLNGETAPSAAVIENAPVAMSSEPLRVAVIGAREPTATRTPPAAVNAGRHGVPVTQLAFIVRSTFDSVTGRVGGVPDGRAESDAGGADRDGEVGRGPGPGDRSAHRRVR